MSAALKGLLTALYALVIGGAVALTVGAYALLITIVLIGA